MKPIRQTEKEKIIKTLQKTKLYGYGFTTKNLWNEIQKEIPHPTLLIAEGADCYANYNGEEYAWGEWLIKGFNSECDTKIIVILGCEEYFLKHIFVLLHACKPEKQETTE